ncbi:SipW-dependent-type signal peptide-containing protein [Salinigranum sp. GCM10025319]|uniref:SipW-dependent-type signal peptide-containing protein n=1 Tax=Salinigranum sp. GCM10025319 TaxID=3252687 RepID=UPI003620EF60
MSDRFDLSRRKMLGAMGTIGGAAALGGAGTMAFFSDTEEFANNQLTAGELDMKVGYSAHYSDWSSDEDGSDTPDDDSDDVEVRMWDGAPNTTGTADDLDDGETGLPANDAWLIAVDDPDQFLENTQYSDPAIDGASCDGDDAEDLPQPVIELDDVKPGDFGEVTFDFILCDNPGYVWLNGSLRSASENGVNEPESKDPQEQDGVVELLDVVQVAFWVDDGDNYQDGDESPAFVGSLREALDALSAGGTANNGRDGALLAGDLPAEDGGGMGANCFSAEIEHSVAFAWWVPVDHGNEIQSDSAVFDLGFYTEQCRHNSATIAERVTLGDNIATPRTFATTTSESHLGSGSWQSAGPDKEILYLGPNPDFTPDFDGPLPSFTIDEIDEISYWTKKSGGPSDVDFYLLVYTEPQGGTVSSDPATDDASWYNKRLNAEPYFVDLAGDSVDAPANEWNEWSTAGTGGTGPLRFVDTNRSGIGFGYADGTMPTLQDLQAGPIDWSALRSGAQSSSIDYGSQPVKSLAVSTGSAWNGGFAGYLDEIVVRLTDGTTVTFDLEE